MIANKNLSLEKESLALKLKCSFMSFIKIMYEAKNDRPFLISNPEGRESHFITIDKELKDVFLLKTSRLLINIPPGHGKSTILAYWVAWCMSIYPDCQFLYISYSYELAEKHTATIKEIMQLPLYEELFDVRLRTDSKSKGSFRTTKGGCVKAFGSSGTITGQDGGLPNLDRFSGAVIMDDMHKPDECHSDTMRGKVKRNYSETIVLRKRGPNVPFIFIGQRLHEDDLPAFLLSGGDGYDWKKVILKGIDEAGNALYPENFSKESLLIQKRVDPYTFFAQQQQTPQPEGGGIFQKEDFKILGLEPNIISTFLTVDTAETDKDYNDATVFSLWGVYKIEHAGYDTGLYGLHWMDCSEIRVEPKDLEEEFYRFYAAAMGRKIKPSFVVIEKKSTGVTLSSVLKSVPGIRVVHLERTKSKVVRFLEAQPYVAKGYISLPEYGRHTKICIEHCGKITANNTHAHDDIADTLYDAIKIALIDQVALPREDESSKFMHMMNSNFNQIQNLRAGIR